MIFEHFSTFYGQHSVMAAWATRSPWSIMYTVHSKQSLVVIVLMFPLFFITSNWFVFYIIIYNYFILFQTACVCHPWWRTEAKLAIVFTNFFLGSRRLACTTRGGGRKRTWPFFPLLFYTYCFSPTLGKPPWLKICFPPYFGITIKGISEDFVKNFIFFLT